MGALAEHTPGRRPAGRLAAGGAAARRATAEPAGTGGAGRVVSPALVGRDAELEQLAGVVAAAPSVAVVEGEAGVGKTRLLAELHERPEAAGRLWLSGGCRQIREPFPLGPVVEALRGAGDTLNEAPGLNPVAGALRPLLPELADALPAAPEPLGDRAAERHRVFRGLVEVLDALAPAVLALEDLHWADEHTVEFLAYLLAEPPDGVAVVLTYRGGDADSGVAALTSRLPASVGRADVALEPLDPAQTGALAGAILGEDHVSAEFAGYLHERTAGLPFAIEEVLALLRERGSLVKRDRGWTRRELDELDVPPAIRDSVLERLAHLSDDARAVAEAAAVLQGPATTALLSATAGIDLVEALPAVADTLRGGLLVDEGEHLGFRHTLAAQTVYEAIPGPQRQHLHDRAVSVLQALDTAMLGELAHHLRHAGRKDEWVTAAERAADRAAELGNDDETVRLLECVILDAPLGNAKRAELALKLGHAAQGVVGPIGDIIEVLSEIAEQEPPGPVRGELRFQLACLGEHTGNEAKQQRQLFAGAVDDLHERPALRAWAMVGLAMPTVAGIDARERKKWLDLVEEAIDGVDDPDLAALLLGKIAMVRVAMGDPGWRRVLKRIETATSGAPQNRHEVKGYWSVGMEACYSGHTHDADRLLEAAVTGAAACENEQLLLRIRSTLALQHYFTGRWDGLADEVKALSSELIDYLPARSVAELVGGCLSLVRGESERATEQLLGVMDAAETAGGFDLLPIPMSALSRIAAVRADSESAAALVDRFLRTMEPMRPTVSMLRALPAVTEALLLLGRDEKARSLVREHEREGKTLDAPLAPAALPYARGHIQAHRRRWAAAAELYRQAAAAYDRLSAPYEAAQALEHLGRCLQQVEGSEDHARDAFSQAMSAFDHLGAIWDRDRAAGLARQHGVASPHRSRRGRKGYGDGLSPREREVAGLIAQHRTNAEIAAELFLSARTVEKHVTGAMRKLGVESRRAISDDLLEAHGGDGHHPPH